MSLQVENFFSQNNNLFIEFPESRNLINHFRDLGLPEEFINEEVIAYLQIISTKNSFPTTHNWINGLFMKGMNYKDILEQVFAWKNINGILDRNNEFMKNINKCRELGVPETVIYDHINPNKLK